MWETPRFVETSGYLLFRIRQEKGAQTPLFWGRDIFWWGGDLPREGVKKFGVSSEARENKVYWRGILRFWLGYPGRARKV